MCRSDGRSAWERSSSITSFSTFFIKGAQGRGVTTSILWAKRKGNWKAIAYESDSVEGVGDRGMPDVRREIETKEPARGEAEPALIARALRFLQAWLVDKAYDEAFGMFLPESYACVNLDLEADQQATEGSRGAGSATPHGHAPVRRVHR